MSFDWYDVVVGGTAKTGAGARKKKRAIDIAKELRSKSPWMRELSVVSGRTGQVIWKEQKTKQLRLSKPLISKKEGQGYIRTQRGRKVEIPSKQTIVCRWCGASGVVDRKTNQVVKPLKHRSTCFLVMSGEVQR